MELEYALVDVFAERPLEGNMLAIFADGRGLSDEQMQALARETNLSETTFVLPADGAQDSEEAVRVRIFTTEEELPFAGHPTLGTASWLYWNHPRLKGAQEIVLQLNSGKIPVRFEPPAAGELGVFGRMRQRDPAFGLIHDRAEVAQAIGMAVDDLDADHPIQTVSTGMPFCIVQVRSVEALGRLNMPRAAAQAYLDAHESKFFYCVAPVSKASAGDADFRTRMQWYSGEDPATGSAAGCAIAYLVKQRMVESGQTVVFEQGVEVNRPSRIHVQASENDFGIVNVFVGGRTIPVANGRFFLPG
jgi:trans-2,3-dihydro-3-hydroxyanthranilate isomerase